MYAKEQKNKLRRELKKQRAVLSPEFVARESAKITERVLQLEEMQNAKTVFVYVSIGKEVATQELITTFLEQGKVVCVPKMTSTQEMTPVQIFSLSNLIMGPLGILEPKSDSTFVDAIDLCIVPGLAFDYSGARLGMGGGHYDRFFGKSKKTHTLGFTFDQFIIKNVPQQTHDHRIDEVLSQSQHIMGGCL